VTTRTAPDEQEAHGRAVVVGRSIGYCQTGCGHQGSEWVHRVARGRGGSWAPVNGLWLCSFCHAATHARQTLARSCGWMVPTHHHPAQVPALIATQLGPGWHVLDEMDEQGRPTNLARLAEPGEVPAGMWSGTLTDALTALRTRVA